MIIKNKILPPKGYEAIAIFPFIFVRKDIDFDSKDLNHEKIHLFQQKTLIIISLLILIPVIWYFSLPWWFILLSYFTFYILYGIFCLIYGYRNTPFEKEAYDSDDNLNYLDDIKLLGWLNHLT